MSPVYRENISVYLMQGALIDFYLNYSFTSSLLSLFSKFWRYGEVYVSICFVLIKYVIIMKLLWTFQLWQTSVGRKICYTLGDHIYLYVTENGFFLSSLHRCYWQFRFYMILSFQHLIDYQNLNSSCLEKENT